MPGVTRVHWIALVHSFVRFCAGSGKGGCPTSSASGFPYDGECICFLLSHLKLSFCILQRFCFTISFAAEKPLEMLELAPIHGILFSLERSLPSLTLGTSLPFFPSFLLPSQTNRKDFRQKKTYTTWKLSQGPNFSHHCLWESHWDQWQQGLYPGTKCTQFCQLLLRKLFLKMNVSVNLFENELCLLALWNFQNRP